MKKSLSGMKISLSGARKSLSGAKKSLSGKKKSLSGAKKTLSGMKNSLAAKNYFLLWGLQKSLVAPPLGIFSVAPLVKTIFSREHVVLARLLYPLCCCCCSCSCSSCCSWWIVTHGIQSNN
jgi:hypothetical protein